MCVFVCVMNRKMDEYVLFGRSFTQIKTDILMVCFFFTLCKMEEETIFWFSKLWTFGSNEK